METDCDCKIHLKPGERTKSMAEQHRRNQGDLPLAAAFLCPGDTVLPSVADPGQCSVYKHEVRSWCGDPTSLRPCSGSDSLLSALVSHLEMVDAGVLLLSAFLLVFLPTHAC